MNESTKCGDGVKGPDGVRAPHNKEQTMNKLAQLILAHTVIGMKKSLYEADTVLCLCGVSLEGVSGHAEHAVHLAEELSKAGYGPPKRMREFDLGDRVETYQHDKGEVVGWSMTSLGDVTYQVHLPVRGIYTYKASDLRKA